MQKTNYFTNIGTDVCHIVFTKEFKRLKDAKKFAMEYNPFYLKYRNITRLESFDSLNPSKSKLNLIKEIVL